MLEYDAAGEQGPDYPPFEFPAEKRGIVTGTDQGRRRGCPARIGIEDADIGDPSRIESAHGQLQDPGWSDGDPGDGSCQIRHLFGNQAQHQGQQGLEGRDTRHGGGKRGQLGILLMGCLLYTSDAADE